MTPLQDMNRRYRWNTFVGVGIGVSFRPGAWDQIEQKQLQVLSSLPLSLLLIQIAPPIHALSFAYASYNNM